ncbi:hypothetical protein AX15_004599 [Amanita polypyramis BW_CC]|nr:hypothetical protein AX15_004599 [Amanita polypyramis BW_CC]
MTNSILSSTPVGVQTPEEEPLLPRRKANDQRSMFAAAPQLRWKASPYWLMPAILAVNMARGVTMAPRIQVYKVIACKVLDTPSSTSSLQLNSSIHSLMDCTGPDVAARAAKIQASVITIMSILSAVATGFWSRLGDSYGRKPIFITFLTGAMLMEFVFILVMRRNTIFDRYAEQFLLLGPVAEGIVGGIQNYHGIVHAYISDCTPHGSRSKIFATAQGIVFIGLSAGPWLTGLILPPTITIDVFFYISILILIFTFAYMLLLCPESLERAALVDTARHIDNERAKTPPLHMIRNYGLKFISALISPIAMFAPRPLLGHPQKKSYSVTLVGLALFIYLISNGVFRAKYLYAQHLYSWTTAELGNYMSLLWIMRAINLLVVLPIVISFLKPKASVTGPGSTSNPQNLASELRFDRLLAQSSLMLDFTLDLMVVLISRNSQITFIILSCITSFTSGGNPSLHSLGAICLHACGYSSEVGTLFGAKAVLSAVAHVISPYIFATTYASTVAYFPQAIFVLAVILIFISFMLLTFVRPSLKDIELVHATRTAEEQSDNPPEAEEGRA